MNVFTPADEPYLGRQSVRALDEMIVRFLEAQRTIADWTRANDLTPLQRAASELIPSASSVALSVRELVRQGYLLSALILTRPLMERTATISYLVEHPHAVALWAEGWPHKSRPALGARLDALMGPAAPGRPSKRDVAQLLDRYNSLVHGDPAGALHGAIVMSDGSAGYTVGKDVGSPRRADEVCHETAMWLVVLVGRCEQAFPEALAEDT